ncbi:MAG: hypothetical protein ACYCY1_10035 [Sulfuriferula sp.]
MLQGLAPLLHAHVLEFSMPNKIHIDGLEIDVSHHPVDEDAPQLKLQADESTAIGMQSAYKNDKRDLVVNAFVPAMSAVAFTLPLATAPPLFAFLAAIAPHPSGFHFLPPPHAPPGVHLR